MEPITIKNLSFAYDGAEPLFEHCSLDLDSSWKLGVLGRNGRGKTTFFHLLQDQLKYQGSIQTNLDFAMFPLTITDPTSPAWLSLTAVVPQLAQWKVERELTQLEADPNLLWQPFQTMSGGEQTKVLLAVLFAQDDVFPLLDEPTNHLDRASRQQVAHYLQAKRQGFMITSHDRDFLDQVIDHCLVIERHQLILEKGNYSTYFQQKQRRDQTARSQNQELRSSIKRLKKAQQQRQSWAQRAEKEKIHNSHADKGFIGAKAAKMMKKSVIMNQRIDNAINAKQGLLQEVETIVPLTINCQASHHDPLLRLNQVGLRIDDRTLCHNLSLVLHPHQQVALVGPNGSGKSSLLKAITGHFAGKQSGAITLAHDLQISIVRQQYLDHHGSLAQFAHDNQLAEEDLLNLLRKLGMDRATFNVPIEKMSLGQQKKVELARSLAQPAQLYLWDEPLNYLDTYNQDQLIQLIQEYQPTMIVVEHDQHFLTQVTNQQIQF